MNERETSEIAGEDLSDLHAIVLRGDDGRVVKLRDEAAIGLGLTASKAKAGEQVRVVWGGPTLGVPSYAGSDGRPHVETFRPREQLYRSDGETLADLEVTVGTKKAIEETAGILRLGASEFLEAVARLQADPWMDLMRAVRDRVEEDFPRLVIQRQGCAGRDVIQTELGGKEVAAREIGSERLRELRHSLYATYGLTPRD